MKFREESISESTKKYGAPFGSHVNEKFIISAFFLSFFCCFFIYIKYSNMARKESVKGFLVPVNGVSKILVNKTGVITKVLVSEGDFIKKGDVLASISSSPHIALGRELFSVINENIYMQKKSLKNELISKIEQLESQKKELEVRKVGLVEQIADIKNSIFLQERRILIQDGNYKSFVQLAEDGMISNSALKAKEEEFIGAKQSLLSLIKDLKVKENDIHQIDIQIKRVSSEKNIINIENEKNQIILNSRLIENEASYSEEIKSNFDGVVTALQMKEGLSVNSNQILASIIPVDNKMQGVPLEAEIWAPSRAIGFVKRGNKVKIMVDAFPYQHFGVVDGIVKTVSIAPAIPSDFSHNNQNEALFKIIVSLDKNSFYAFGQKWVLAAGMNLSADLILEERSFLDWLFEPLIASKKRSG